MASKEQITAVLKDYLPHLIPVHGLFDSIADAIIEQDGAE